MLSANNKVVLFTAVLFTTLVACNANQNSPAAKEIVVADSASSFLGVVDTSAPVTQQVNSFTPPKVLNETTPAQHIDWDKKIIKTAVLSIEAKNYKTFNDLVHEQVKQVGGYVAGEEQSKSEYKIENVATIKVPVDQFDNLVRSLTSTKDENVVSQKVTSQDVTGEVIDTRSRTEAKRQVRLRYLELLKQAKNMEDILKVQEEINNIQEEIEAGAGRVGYLTHAAAYSTIELTFYQVLNAQAVQPDKAGFGDRVLAALGNGLSWVGEMLVLLLTLWPLWLCAGGVWWLIKRYRTKPKTIQ